MTVQSARARCTHRGRCAAGDRAGRQLAEDCTDKGLNFPDTDLEVAPLTAKDREDLALWCVMLT
jgi:pyruvate kinase